MKISEEHFIGICKEAKLEAQSEENYWWLVFRKACLLAKVEPNVAQALGDPPKTWLYQNSLLQTMKFHEDGQYEALNIAHGIFQETNV